MVWYTWNMTCPDIAFFHQCTVGNGTGLGAECPLHACQGCCDPVLPHSTSPLTFCRPDSVTIVNTCCKGIMTTVSPPIWLKWSHLALYRYDRGCFTSLAQNETQPMLRDILISPPLQSHYGAVSTVSHKQTLPQRGTSVVRYFPSSTGTLEEKHSRAPELNWCVKSKPPWQSFLRNSSGASPFFCKAL